MPKYVYECPHGHVAEEYRSIAERDAPLECPGDAAPCGLPMKRVEIPSATPYVTRPGVGDRSPFSRDRSGT